MTNERRVFDLGMELYHGMPHHPFHAPFKEVVNLEEIGKAGVHEFLLVMATLKIRGGTASPVRPLAIA
jgi:kynurenine formamidase